MTETPAAELREAAKLMRERAQAATPGPWERPLDVRHKNVVIAALPEGEQGSRLDGTIPAEWAHHSGLTGRYAGQRERIGVVSAAIWSLGGFMRKRSGRDLDFIASMHPGVALAVADWLAESAEVAERDLVWETPEGPCCAEPAVCGGHDPVWYHADCDGVLVSDCHCFDKALAVARAYLGSDPR